MIKNMLGSDAVTTLPFGYLLESLWQNYVTVQAWHREHRISLS
jgi:hypothetical protein